MIKEMVNDLKNNSFKLIMGWIVGIPLIDMIRGLDSFVISTIQCIFFIFFYSILDQVITRYRRWRKNEVSE